MTRTRNKHKIKTFCFILYLFIISFLFTLAILVLKRKIVFSPSVSIERGFYLLLGADFKEGDLVIFDNPLKGTETYVVDDKKYILTAEDLPRHLIKRVEKIEGERVWLLGNSDEEIKKRRAEGTSFDSRFFGFIPKKDCQKVVYLRLLSNLLENK